MANYTSHYRINFDADVTAAKRKIEELRVSLQNIGQANTLDSKFKGTIQDLNNAKMAALELGQALKNATNTDTGKINLKTFY